MKLEIGLLGPRRFPKIGLARDSRAPVPRGDPTCSTPTRRYQQNVNDGTPSNGRLGPAPTERSDLEKLGVIPDVLVILGQNEPPAGRESQIGKNRRQQLGDLRDAMTLEEIRI
jgi:hypothetical protein